MHGHVHILYVAMCKMNGIFIFPKRSTYISSYIARWNKLVSTYLSLPWRKALPPVSPYLRKSFVKVVTRILSDQCAV